MSLYKTSRGYMDVLQTLSDVLCLVGPSVKTVGASLHIYILLEKKKVRSYWKQHIEYHCEKYIVMKN